MELIQVNLDFGQELKEFEVHLNGMKQQTKNFEKKIVQFCDFKK